MRQKRHHHGVLPWLLGLALMLLGTAVLLHAGDTLQYVFPAPVATQDGNELSELYAKAQAQLSSMADSLNAYAVAARKQGASLSAGAGKSAQATLYAVGEGYFDVMHETLRAGRFVSGGDVARAENVVVIEEKTALALFPGVDPVGQTIEVEGVTCEVAGVIAGGRKLGESDEVVAYMPITAAGKYALAMQTVACVARSADQTTGAAILMEDTLTSWRAGGSFYSLPKMRLGAFMPLRWILLIAGLAVLLALLRRINALAMGRVVDFSEQLKTRYVRDMLLPIVGSVLLCALLYGAWLAALSALAAYSVEPLYVFTEWVPEVVVELSSLQSRFWALNNANAPAVRCVSREVCVLEFGRALMRWGVMSALLGGVLGYIPWLNRRVEMPVLNRDR